MVLLRRVRVSYSDPDATDESDSDRADVDEHDISRRSRTAAAARRSVIVIQPGGRGATRSSHRARAKNGRQRSRVRRRSEIPTAASVEDLPGPSSLSSERMRRAAAAGSSHPGVYLRQRGRWAVDYRDHRRNVRQWLGTYRSKEEATAAYDAYEVKVHASLLRGETPPAPDARCGRGRVKIQQAARRASGRRRKLQPKDPTTATTTESSQATTSSASLASEAAPAVEASAVTPQNPRPLVVDPFLAEEDQFAGDDHFGFGLADLGHLPLTFLDGNMDFELSESDLSLFDVGFM